LHHWHFQEDTMAMQTLSTTAQSTGDQATRARIREVAIEQFGQHGFDIELPAIAEAAGVNAERLTHEFGPTQSLRRFSSCSRSSQRNQLPCNRCRPQHGSPS
jgi:hypothetical protein